MAWTPPTLSDFRTWFPEFVDTTDATINRELSTAIAEVSAGNWVDTDRTPAVLNLVAHRLSALGSGASGGSGGAGTPAGAVIKSRTVGDVKVEFEYGQAAAAAASSFSDYSTTVYGQRYFELLRLNFPGFVVA